MSINLSGVYPPITTPFENGKLACEKLRQNIEKWNQTGLSGLVVMGSNGEFPHLNEDEKHQVIRIVKDTLEQEKDIIVGTGAPGTQTTIERTKYAVAEGAAAIIVIPPYYYRTRMGPSELKTHYQRVADASSVPVILYNMPAFAGLDLSSGLIIDLSEHPNIIGVKDSSGDITQIAQCVSQTANDFSVMAGSGSYLLPTLLMGGNGGVMALANVAPDECVRLYRLAQGEHWEEAVDLQQLVIPVNQTLTSKYSIPGLKYAMDLRGYFGGNPRHPLLPIAEDEKVDIKMILDKANML